MIRGTNEGDDLAGLKAEGEILYDFALRARGIRKSNLKLIIIRNINHNFK